MRTAFSIKYSRSPIARHELEIKYYTAAVIKDYSAKIISMVRLPSPLPLAKTLRRALERARATWWFPTASVPRETRFRDVGQLFPAAAFDLDRQQRRESGEIGRKFCRACHRCIPAVVISPTLKSRRDCTFVFSRKREESPLTGENPSNRERATLRSRDGFTSSDKIGIRLTSACREMKPVVSLIREIEEKSLPSRASHSRFKRAHLITLTYSNLCGAP